MGTNKDQAQAHQFMLGRVIAALTVQETDPEQPPFRRPLLSAIGGIVIGGLLAAGFWVFGLLVPGGDRFTATDVIAVEEETGAIYVLLNGQRHPVINYTSALLALDKHAEVRIVSRAALADIPVGPRIGIRDAPESLPGKDNLLTGDWSMCSQSIVDDGGRSQDTPVLLVGQKPGLGRALDNQALLVHSDNQVYVVQGGYRHAVAKGADVALELGREIPVAVDGTWLDTVPNGKQIGPIPVPDPGRPSAAVPGVNLVTGQLVEVDTGAPETMVEKQYFLVIGDQLRPITSLQAAVQRVFDENAAQPVVVANSVLVDANRVAATRSEEDDPPSSRPKFMTVDNPDATVCAVFQPGNPVPTFVVGASLPSSVLAARSDPVRVSVPAGRAALIEVMSGPDEQPGQGTVALVTDQGRLYPLEDPQHVVQVLGFDGVAPVRITATLADRLPRGESLDPAAARTPVGDG